jgi:hypothetical protein
MLCRDANMAAQATMVVLFVTITITVSSTEIRHLKGMLHGGVVFGVPAGRKAVWRCTVYCLHGR